MRSAPKSSRGARPASGWPGAVPLAFAIACALASGAQGAALEPFFGTFVGVAKVESLEDDTVRQRDMDIEIEPYKQGGFKIHWINVTLVDGRRAAPGESGSRERRLRARTQRRRGRRGARRPHAAGSGEGTYAAMARRHTGFLGLDRR